MPRMLDEEDFVRAAFIGRKERNHQLKSLRRQFEENQRQQAQLQAHRLHKTLDRIKRRRELDRTSV